MCVRRATSPHWRRADKQEAFWLRNDLYYLKMEDERILMDDKCWLNDRIMDAAQHLVCKALGNLDTYQSVLNCQRKSGAAFQAVDNEHVQLLHDGKNHWITTIGYTRSNIRL